MKQEAYAVVRPGEMTRLHHTRAGAKYNATLDNLVTYSIVRLVEHNPAAEAALRILSAWAKSLRPLPPRVEVAIERYEKSQKRRVKP